MMTSYHAYTFYIKTNGSNSKKDIIEKLMKHGDFMIFENEKLNEVRIWLYNADEAHIENKILHSFNRLSEKYAIEQPRYELQLSTQWLHDFSINKNKRANYSRN